MAAASLPGARGATRTPRASAPAAAQRAWQAELRQDAAGAEPGDRRDPVALEPEDERRVGSRDLGPGRAKVDAERRLGVGAGRHEERRAAAGRAVAQERAD